MANALTAIVFLLTAVLLQIGCGPSHLTFQAKVSDLHKPVNTLSKDKSPEDTVEVNLPGKLLPSATPLELIRREHADWSTPEHAASAIVSANLTGDQAWILDSFVPAERESMSKQFSDPAVVMRTRDYYRNIGTIKLVGWTELRGVRVELLRGDDQDGDASFLTINLSESASGWRQTNALANDNEYEVVWTALHTGGIR